MQQTLRDMGLIPGSGRSPGGKAQQPTPVFWPGEFIDWIVHGFAKIQTRLSNFHFTLKASLNVSDIHLMSKQLHPEEETF